MIINILILVFGLLILVKGADWLVDGASALAKKHHISDLAIGLTIVAFGTSAPELVVNVFAAADNFPAIVFGNIIGSNLFNLFAILGITGLIMPIAVQSSTVWKEIPISFLAIVVLFILGNDFYFQHTGTVSRLDGILLLLFFAGFLWYVYKQLKTDPNVMETSQVVLPPWKIYTFIAVGLGALVLGGKLVVNSAVNIANVLGISQEVIGLTIVAAGTSLPELATSVVAALKKNNDIAVGNIIGSNIFNIFLIIGVSAIIRPLHYIPTFNIDLYILAIGTLLLFIAMFIGKKKKLDRWEAAFLLSAYIGYVVYLIAKI